MGITPTEDMVIAAALNRNTTMAVKKMASEIKAENAGWELSENRLKKILGSEGFLAAKRGEISKPLSSTILSDVQLEAINSFSEAIEGYQPEVVNSCPVKDVERGLEILFQAMKDFPIFPRVLLKPEEEEEDSSGLPPPELPEDPFHAQVQYRETSPRQLIIYGRGKYNYGITPNSNQAIYYDTIFDSDDYASLEQRNNRKQNKKDRAPFSDDPAVRILWEFYEVSARQAGVSRADVGRQFEAEWGVNMDKYLPPRNKNPEVQKLNEKWEQRRAELFKQNLYPVLQTILGRDSVGWDPIKNAQFSVIVVKIDKETDEECGNV